VIALASGVGGRKSRWFVTTARNSCTGPRQTPGSRAFCQVRNRSVRGFVPFRIAPVSVRKNVRVDSDHSPRPS
jgi:hypothetical protein